jgi:hypothetical protein
MYTIDKTEKENLYNYFNKYALYNSVGIALYVVSTLLIGLLLSNEKNKFDELPNQLSLHQIAFPASIILALGLIIFQVLRIYYRKSRLNLLLSHIEKGSGVVFQDATIKYQFVFGKSSGRNNWVGEWKFLPIQMGSFLLLENAKTIFIPLSEKSKSTLLNYISGDKENRSIAQIWGTESPLQTLASWDELETLLKNKFSSQLSAISKIQTTSGSTVRSGCMFWVIMLFSFASIGLGIYRWYKADPKLVGEIIGLIAIGGIILYSIILWILSIFWKRKEIAYHKADSYQKQILPEFISQMNKSFVFREQSFLNRNEIAKSKLFISAKYITEGDSQLAGKYNGVAFQLCNLYVTAPDTYHQKRDSDEVEVFSGWAMMASFNKSFKGRTTVIANKNWLEQLTGNFDYIDTASFGSKIQLEDPQFSKLFRVYSYDQIEARYLLTPSLMERIKQIMERHNGILHLSFVDNLLYIFNNNDSSYVCQQDYLSSVEDYQQFYNDISSTLSIIDDLQLNIQIWKQP